MQLIDYLKGTRDTWNNNPLDTFGDFKRDMTHTELSIRLNKQHVVIGCVDEFYELIRVLGEPRDVVIDECGDALYFVMRSADEFDLNVDLFEVLLSPLKTPNKVLISQIEETIKIIVDKFTGIINKGVYRQKDFDDLAAVNIIANIAQTLSYILGYADITLEDVMQHNYNKLHNINNLDARGLCLNN